MTTRQGARLRAAILEFEYPCENCHKRRAESIFDHFFVCGPCRVILDRRLQREGNRDAIKRITAAIGRSIVSARRGRSQDPAH